MLTIIKIDTEATREQLQLQTMNQVSFGDWLCIKNKVKSAIGREDWRVREHLWNYLMEVMETIC